jgi:hypothetical protein
MANQCQQKKMIQTEISQERTDAMERDAISDVMDSSGS